MPRLVRMESPTGYYHVMMRGNNREMIFSKPFEKQYFIELLQLKKDEGLISIIAYCLMDNHVHLLVRSDLEAMSEAIKWINVKYALRYNYIYDRIGHVFQDRYKSEVINTDGHLLQAIRYIHNNPVKAKIVTKVSDYSWSSYKGYIYKHDDKLISSVEKKMIMGMFSQSLDEFEEFHSPQEQIDGETYEFLDVKIDIELEREEKARIIIDNYCRQYGIIDARELYNKNDVLEKIIIELLKKSNLTHRRISEITNTTRGIVHKIAKKAL